MDAESKILIDMAEENSKLFEIFVAQLDEIKAENVKLKKELVDQSHRCQEILNLRLKEIMTLREAIKEHKESFDDDEVTTEEDNRLWRILEEG